MYYPYFRGKQYELITIRESSKLLADSQFVPIIEPVKESTSGLERAVSEVSQAGGECILVVNPKCGSHCEDSKAIRSLVKTVFANFAGLSAGILLTSAMSATDAKTLCDQQANRPVTLVHYGFEDGRVLAEALADCPNVTRHVFVDGFCTKLYRRHFLNNTRILLKDGFKKRDSNRDYPNHESFSDLHVTFEDEGMNGFGDFLVVGKDFSEYGGPAYAVAIHLTYIDEQKDNEMFIYHFLSERINTPTDPAGKFAEAVSKLATEVEKDNSPILRSLAVQEFLDLHRTHHFPGLGYVKKLSMQHHIETLADYVTRS